MVVKDPVVEAGLISTKLSPPIEAIVVPVILTRYQPLPTPVILDPDNADPTVVANPVDKLNHAPDVSSAPNMAIFLIYTKLVVPALAYIEHAGNSVKQFRLQCFELQCF